MEKVKMRSRQFPDLTNYEIEQYLKRNDLIVIPVGHCECLGPTPVDGEYVGAHAWANLIAEYADGLVLPGVQYTCAGGTEIGRGTIHMDTDKAMEYCLALAHSLLTQGFRTQIWLPSHGPQQAFLGGMVTQFMTEAKQSILYLEPRTLLQKMGLVKPFDFSSPTGPEPVHLKDGTLVGRHDQTLGAYQICGRLDIYPAKGEVEFPEGEDLPMSATWAPWYTDECERLFWCSEIVTPSPIYFENCRQHGGDPMALFTREELKQHADIGEKYMRELAEAADFPGLVAALKKLNKEYMHGSAIPQNMDHLPPNKYAPVWWYD